MGAEVRLNEGLEPMYGKVQKGLSRGIRKSNGSRKPYDVILMFKVQVLQHLYNLADE